MCYTGYPPTPFLPSQHDPDSYGDLCLAILSILMNKDQLNLGDKLAMFKEFTRDLPAEVRGLAISNADDIREVDLHPQRKCIRLCPQPYLLTDVFEGPQ